MSKMESILVTGGGGGIGGAVVRAFAERGCGVVIADLGDSANTMAAAIRADGGRAVGVRADVTRSEDMQALVAVAERELGGLDVLVTCAGLGLSGLLATQAEADWLRVIDVNLNGTYRAIRAVLPRMMAQGHGRIVTIASVLGKMGVTAT
jgi:NAD(P)-dependent dehydrogenase (short-subunit alcohol dehydrogenase family)